LNETRGIGMTSPRTRERLVRRLMDHGITDMRVLERIRQVPRHMFVDEALASRAYEDTALPIGYGQTISQPWVVARMTAALIEPGIPDKVLEVGTGCGYQAAVLAGLVPEVYTVERINALLVQTRQRMRTLGMRNVKMKHSDGGWGWPEFAPFDGIIVTAAPEELPSALLKQMAPGCVGDTRGSAGSPGPAAHHPGRRRVPPGGVGRGEFRPAGRGQGLMRWFSVMYDRTLVWAAHRHAPWYLGGMSFAESSFFPVPVDVMLAPMTLARPERWWWYAAIAAVTSAAGGVAGYLIGYFALDAVTPLLHRMGLVGALPPGARVVRAMGRLVVFIAGSRPSPTRYSPSPRGCGHGHNPVCRCFAGGPCRAVLPRGRLGSGLWTTYRAAVATACGYHRLGHGRDCDCGLAAVARVSWRRCACYWLRCSPSRS
jgi:protein-L-isoaspartate(D-aspartate) O-methyltransferase